MRRSSSFSQIMFVIQFRFNTFFTLIPFSIRTLQTSIFRITFHEMDLTWFFFLKILGPGNSIVHEKLIVNHFSELFTWMYEKLSKLSLIFSVTRDFLMLQQTYCYHLWETFQFFSVSLRKIHLPDVRLILEILEVL